MSRVVLPFFKNSTNSTTLERHKYRLGLEFCLVSRFFRKKKSQQTHQLGLSLTQYAPPFSYFSKKIYVTCLLKL